MRNLIFVPQTGINARVFANWLKLRDMNTINDLVENGVVQEKPFRDVALHPMIQEVAVSETNPSVQSCRILLNSLQETCLRHGDDVSYYKQMFQTIDHIVKLIEKDDIPTYLRFLEYVFPYMEKYKYRYGMEMIVEEMNTLLKDTSFGTVSDRALLLDFLANCEVRTEKAIKYEKEAVELLKEITSDNVLLASNLRGNLGGMYRESGKLELAKQHMEAAIHLLEEYGLVPYHDSIPQIVNYVMLLRDMGQLQLGLSALQKLARGIREITSDKTADYGAVQEAMGKFCLTMGDVPQATTHLKKALAIYETVFESEPEMIEENKQDILETYAQTGVYFGYQLFSNNRQRKD